MPCGRPTGLGVVRDVVRRRYAWQSLRRSEQRPAEEPETPPAAEKGPEILGEESLTSDVNSIGERPSCVEILFKTGKLRKECNDYKLLVRRYGPHRAMLIGRRLDELRAAEVLQHMSGLRGARCHELKGDLKGKLSVDLDHPYRLIFEPADEPVPLKPDGGLDWARVTAVRVIGVKDTHG
jgi:plasmid maintenance system killer protein